MSVFIDELYIVAGSRSSGKSTFIEWCKTANKLGEIPPELVPIAHFDEPVYFAELGRFADSYHQKLLVHVDIFTPFTDLLLSTESALLDGLSVENFSSYPSTLFLGGAKQINIFTLRASRKIVWQRLLNRCVSRNSELMRTLLAQIYSDVYGDVPFDQLYAVWDEFSFMLPNAKRWYVVEQDRNGYALLEMRKDF